MLRGRHHAEKKAAGEAERGQKEDEAGRYRGDSPGGLSLHPEGQGMTGKAANHAGRAGEEMRRKVKIREYVEAFAVALLVALLVRTFVIQAFKIPSGSMENTLLVGDHILRNKFLYGYHIPYTRGRVLSYTTPRHGDIIVFVFPADPSKDFINPVLGVPGDTMAIL